MSDPKWMSLPSDKCSEIRKAANRLGRKDFTLMVESVPNERLTLCVVKRLENDPLVRIDINNLSIDAVTEMSEAVMSFAKHVWNRRDIWELPLGDADDPINIDKVRSPVQLLMQMDEMNSRIEVGCPEGYGHERYCEQTMAFDDGFYSAFRYALIRPQDDINHLAEHGTGYVSYGDDTVDFFESGFDNGIAWCAGKFEWTADGEVIEESIKQ